MQKGKTVLTAMATLAAGAAAMYYLDPDRGRRRRALVRDKVVAVSHGAADLARMQGKRTADRIKGLLLMTRSRFRHDGPIDDVQLHERIRSRLGRVVSHPKAVDVAVQGGRAVLSGHILAEEVDKLLATLSSMPGVNSVENKLSVHEAAGKVPALQGKKPQRGMVGKVVRPTLALMAVAAPIALLLRANGKRPLWRRRKGLAALMR